MGVFPSRLGAVKDGICPEYGVYGANDNRRKCMKSTTVLIKICVPLNSQVGGGLKKSPQYYSALR